jgi:hypothetical protein
LVGARLDADVDHAGRAQAILCRQCAGDQRQRVGDAWREDLAEEREALRQLHAVETVLQAAMVAAHVDLAEPVLHHAGRAQQHLIERRVLALRRVGNGSPAEIVLGGTEAWQNRAAFAIEALGGDLDRRDLDRVGGGRCGLGEGSAGGREGRGESQCRYADTPSHHEPRYVQML